MKGYISRAVDLTHNALTLLPPLIVTVYPEEYNELVHDASRLNWDNTTSRRKLTYYRPILVYGNQLHVAVKGLVGNTEIKQISNRTDDVLYQKIDKKVHNLYLKKTFICPYCENAG